MKKISILLLLFVFILMSGCENNSRSERGFVTSELDAGSYESAKQINEEIAEPETISRKLIKEGWVEFETPSIESTRTKVLAIVEQHKGYISSDNVYKSPGRTSNNIVIRIPSDDFDSVLSEATSDVKKIDSKQVNVKDVTEEFLDIEARLKTKKELENRFLELLQQAKTVTEILEIESQIGNLRSEIESIEGRLKYLESQVSFSTLNLTFYETYASETAFAKKFKDGFRNGWDNLFWFFVFLTNIWPFIVLGIVMIFGIRWYRRR